MGIFGKKQKPVEREVANGPDATVEHGSGSGFIRRFTSTEYKRALADWTWLDVDGLSPIAASPFGDMFLTGRGGVWFLDTLEGSLDREFDDEQQWRATLETQEGQDRYLLAGLAMGAANRGLIPGPSQVYAFSVPPVLGGAFDLANVEVLDLVVASCISGQLHRQVRELPPGTTITGFTVDGD